jgi:hypothetical protein
VRDVDAVREEAARLFCEGTELRNRLAAWQRQACALLRETHDATVTDEGEHDCEMAAFLGLEGVEELVGDLNEGMAEPILTTDV